MATKKKSKKKKSIAASVTGRKKFSKATKAKISKLGLKERKFILGVFRGESDRQAALEADYSLWIASRPKKIKTPEVMEAMQAMLDEIVPLDLALLRLRQGMSATKTELAKFEGSITDALEVTDNSIRVQAAKEVLAAHVRVNDPEHGSGDRIIVNIDTGREDSKKDDVQVRIERE